MESTNTAISTNAKEEDKAEEEKVDEKEYLPSFNLLDPEKTGMIPIEAVNDLLSKLEGPTESKVEKGSPEKLKEYPNGKTNASLIDFVKEIRSATTDPEKFERAMKYTFKLFDFEAKGYLVENDLKRVFEALGQSVTPEDLTNMIKMVGIKGKDKITYEEFKDFFKKQL